MGVVMLPQSQLCRRVGDLAAAFRFVRVKDRVELAQNLNLEPSERLNSVKSDSVRTAKPVHSMGQ